MSMQRLQQPDADDEDPPSSSPRSADSRHRLGFDSCGGVGGGTGGGGGGGGGTATSADITPSTTMTTADACSLSTTPKSNCSSPGSSNTGADSSAQHHNRKQQQHHHNPDQHHSESTGTTGTTTTTTGLGRPRPAVGYVKDEPLNIRHAEVAASSPLRSPAEVAVIIPTSDGGDDNKGTSHTSSDVDDNVKTTLLESGLTTPLTTSNLPPLLPHGGAAINSHHHHHHHQPHPPASPPPSEADLNHQKHCHQHGGCCCNSGSGSGGGCACGGGTTTTTTTTTAGSTPPSLLQVPPGDHQGGGAGADSESLYSLHMRRDFRYYFQHPYFRLTMAYLVTFLNFLLYAEDPVSHSEAECFIPVVGNCFSFVCTKYPPNAWAAVKVIMWLTAMITGLFVGKLLIHDILFNRLFKLKMFFDDKGSWMTMFFTVIFHLFIFSHIYNAVLMLGGDFTLPYRIDAQMGMRNSSFMKIAACGTWCGDFFTAWMVTDVMLQEKLYPQWAKWPRSWWNKSRVILFWFMVTSFTFAFILVISTDWIKWDRLNKDFMPTNELSRAFLASFILVFDLLIVMQDWDFPHFIYSLDIKLPGVNTAHIRIHIPKFLRKEVWAVHITGKWFNYGIIFMVMILDLNMWKNQMFYEPFAYGQYVGPNHRIHTVRDQDDLAEHNISMLSHEWRSSNWNHLTNQTYIQGDMVMNTQYLGHELSSKGMAFIPSLLAFVCFGILVWYFGRWRPTETYHYSDRLKMRKKRLTIIQRIQQSIARRRAAARERDQVSNGGRELASKVNLVRMKQMAHGQPYHGEMHHSMDKGAVFDTSAVDMADYEPLTTLVEDNNHHQHHHQGDTGSGRNTNKPEIIRAPLATPEKV